MEATALCHSVVACCRNPTCCYISHELHIKDKKGGFSYDGSYDVDFPQKSKSGINHRIKKMKVQLDYLWSEQYESSGLPVIQSLEC